MIRKRMMIAFGLTLCSIFAAWAAAKQNPTPPPVILNNEQGEQVQLYAKSYALLIGVSSYRIWPDLPGVNDDIPAVRAVLEQHGFEVIPVINPKNYAELDRAFRNFINTYGSDAENRLLFYFAGHGKTLPRQDGKDMGYLVAADAPFAEKNRNGFLDNALDMATVAGYAKNIQAKHALFLFDSCFSGSIFENTRGEPDELAYYKASKPVRQFITSGSKDERVPDRSVFREEFVAALEGEGDVNGDGYVTGGELGNFLDNRVVLRRKDEQHPQYGKMSDYDKGDVVFALPKAAQPASTPLSVTDDAPQVAFSLEDDAVVPESWQTYATQMTAAFRKVQQYEQQNYTAAKKAAAWQKFATAFEQDNPYDAQDEEMRQYAAQRIAALQAVTPKPTAKPTSTPLSVTSCWENATPGATCTEEMTGMEFVWIPSGSFQMGCSPQDGACEDDEKPAHRVTLDGFWMGKYEVTQAQWERIMGNNPSNFKGADRPVESVTWNDAQVFLEKLNAAGIVGNGHARSLRFRLPSEAEWEYAARAGTQTAYSFGNDVNELGKYAWYDEDWKTGHHPVGQKQPNQWGLYDMHGNVWEWGADTYHDNYNGAPTDGSIWGNLGNKKAKLMRGGSWYYSAINSRSSSRRRNVPDNSSNRIGLRVVVGAR